MMILAGFDGTNHPIIEPGKRNAATARSATPIAPINTAIHSYSGLRWLDPPCRLITANFREIRQTRRSPRTFLRNHYLNPGSAKYGGGGGGCGVVFLLVFLSARGM